MAAVTDKEFEYWLKVHFVLLASCTLHVVPASHQEGAGGMGLLNCTSCAHSALL